MSIIVDQILSFHFEMKVGEFQPSMKLEDLGADSLDCLEICMNIEDQFTIKIDDEELEKTSTVQDIYDLVDRKQKEKSSNSHLNEGNKNNEEIQN